MNMLFASIITIGDELLIGQTIDTNSAFIAQELNKLGIWVRRRVAVGDDAVEIRAALDEEGRQSQLVILTGGLGPTADDITKPLLCGYFGGQMVVNEAVRQHVIYLFEKVYRRPGPILERNLRQAEVPDVATVLHNERGSAPGMWFEKEGTIFISLPGVPHEMKGIMTQEVLPRLQQHFVMPAIVHRTAFTAGQGESMIAEKLMGFEAKLPPHIKLAYLPSYGMVKLRLTATGTDKAQVEQEVELYFRELLERVKDVLVSDQDEGLEIVIGKILKQKGMTLATAESCTGGSIAQLITSVPGSSAYFKGSIVSYANEAKENLLHVGNDTLRSFGAVSEQTVREMVKGALKALRTDYAIASSGIMGPDGGSAEKPVGTVWLAAGNAERVETLQLHLRFDRQRNIHIASGQALNLLRKFILTNT
jgi:nicotinamide-nucleotide amidase